VQQLKRMQVTVNMTPIPQAMVLAVVDDLLTPVLEAGDLVKKSKVA
jgi:hypothetical protein